MRPRQLLLAVGTLGAAASTPGGAASTAASVVRLIPPPAAAAASSGPPPLPLILWHGLGDAADSPGMQHVAALAAAAHPGTAVYAVALGDGADADRSASFLGNVTAQLAAVCAALAADPLLAAAPAADGLGFSQGGLFLRAYAQRCAAPPLRSLVTFGSPHNGISRFRGCEATDWLCKGAMALLRFRTWSAFVQARLVPAQYFRDPQASDDFAAYLEHSNLLADVNNERAPRNSTYRRNLAALTNLAMFLFEDDSVLFPPRSAWFDEVNGTTVTPLRERALYKDDWLGLRELDRKGGLHLRSVPGDHMQIPEHVLNATIAEFFGPLKTSRSGDVELGEL